MVSGGGNGRERGSTVRDAVEISLPPSSPSSLALAIGDSVATRRVARCDSARLPALATLPHQQADRLHSPF